MREVELVFVYKGSYTPHSPSSTTGTTSGLAQVGWYFLGITHGLSEAE